ncbi:TATA-binding related factor of subunit 20 of mediator complex-domain-containing protein [Cladochytrium replicatum]|nr:TATA-binding related factor of subunit 20 of mediator complex-domain-containing protein [Cladochytrium replicatum]
MGVGRFVYLHFVAGIERLSPSVSAIYLRDVSHTTSNFLTERLVNVLNARQIRPWQISCRVLHQVRSAGPQQPVDIWSDGSRRVMYQLSNSDVEGRIVCMVLEETEETRGSPQVVSGVIVECGKELELLVSKMKNLWAARQTARLEGSVFTLESYFIRIGYIMTGAISRGMILMVEHKDITDEVSRKTTQQLIFYLLNAIKGVNVIQPWCKPAQVTRNIAVWDEWARLFSKFSSDEELLGLPILDHNHKHSAFKIMRLLRADGII